MRPLRNYFIYLIFPLAGILIALNVSSDKLLLRFLIVLTISMLGLIAADSDFRLSSLKQVSLRGMGTSAVKVQRKFRISAGLLMTVALICMILSALELSPKENNIDRIFTTPVLLLLVGTVATWASVAVAAPPVQIAAPSTEALQPLRGRLIPTVVGVVLLLLAGESAGHGLEIALLQGIPLGLQALFFYSGILFVVIGLGGVRGLRRPRLSGGWLPKRGSLSLADPRVEFLLVLLIFLGALVIRAWNLENGLRASIDEALSIDGIGHYYWGQVGLVTAPSIYIPTLVFAQWQGIIVSLLGRSVTSLRLTSVIVGALGVVATYFLARDLFKDRRMGIVAALILMTFPPHIHFSRVSLLHIADPLFGTLAIWFLIRGIQSNKRLNWALAGAALGMTQYFFEAGRLFYVPLVVVWLGAALGLWVLMAILKQARRLPLGGRITHWAENIRLPMISFKGILIAVMVFILVAMPTYYAALSRGGDVNPRLSASGGFSLFLDPLQDGLTGDEANALAQRFLFPFTVYTSQPEIAVFYGGDQALILVFLMPFFFLGLAYLLWRWRSVAVIIPLWLLAGAVSNAFLRDSAVYARWHVVFPAIAVAAAVGLCYMVPVIWSGIVVSGAETPAKWKLGVQRVGMGLVVVALACIMIGQVVYYFGWHVPLLEKQVRLSKDSPDLYDMAIRASALPNDTDIYLIGDPVPDINVPHNWIEFLTRSDLASLHYYPMAAQDFTPQFVAQMDKSRNLAMFISPNAYSAIKLMQDSFACNMEHSAFPIDPPEREFLLCYAPIGTVKG